MTKPIHPRLKELVPEERARLMRALSNPERDAWAAHWPDWAHEGQRPPTGDWRTWVLMAGRGYGKTRAGAQWIDALARGVAGTRDAAAGGAGDAAGGGSAGDGSACAGAGAAGRADGSPVRIALVAATDAEARRVMIEGPSGLLAVPVDHPGARARFEPGLGRLVWPNGSEARLFSGANPEGLRGPEHHYAWCDELAKWRHPQATWDNLQLGLRGGAHPRALVTTTPRGGCSALTAILAAPGTVQSGGASWYNPHLPIAWLEAVEAAYGGTRQGRQEILGLMAEDLAGTLWPAALIEASRSGRAPARERLRRVVIGIDPPASAEGVCGIVACGIDAAGIGHVLADHSAGGLSPDGWARAVAAAVERHEADRLIAEANQGGEMIRTVLRSGGVSLPVRLVSATRGKAARAEPVAGLFEQGRVKLAGHFPALEAELAGLIIGGGYDGPGRSPDRADAMVWALHALMLAPGGGPRVSRP